MRPIPITDNPAYKGSGKLKGKVAIITGGDSGIGRAIAIGFAKEGANMVITYMPHEHVDAETTMQMVESYGQRILLIEGDLRQPDFSKEVVRRTIEGYGKLDILF
jgi:NAD(P)-dependent dehydrogenase (short-subunit alcohol dehydrogenase family)